MVVALGNLHYIPHFQLDWKPPILTEDDFLIKINEITTLNSLESHLKPNNE